MSNSIPVDEPQRQNDTLTQQLDDSPAAGPAQAPEVRPSWIDAFFSAPSGNKTPKLYALDLVRMLLTMWIVSYHCVQKLGYFSESQRAYVQYGYYGVEVFFMMSGFILTFVNFNRFDSDSISSFGKSYLKFAINRFFRIWPLHFIMTMFWLSTDSYCTWDWALKDSTFFDFYYTDTGNHCNAPSWFLHYEMYVCLLLPFFLVALNKSRYTIFGVIAMAIVTLRFYINVVGPEWSILASGSFIRAMAYFSTGISAGYLFYKWPNQHPIFDLFAAGCLYCWQMLWMGDTQDQPDFFYKAVILSIVTLYCLSKGKVFNFVADNPAVTHLAEWSFAIYLIHWAFIKYLRHVFSVFDPFKSAANFLAFAFLHYLVTLPVAVLAFYMVEEKVRVVVKGWLEPPKKVDSAKAKEMPHNIQLVDVKVV